LKSNKTDEKDVKRFHIYLWIRNDEPTKQ